MFFCLFSRIYNIVVTQSPERLNDTEEIMKRCPSSSPSSFLPYPIFTFAQFSTPFLSLWFTLDVQYLNLLLRYVLACRVRLFPQVLRAKMTSDIPQDKAGEVSSQVELLSQRTRFGIQRDGDSSQCRLLGWKQVSSDWSLQSQEY